MVPIHLPENKPSEAILEAEAQLLERDGVYHVGSLYFAKQSDASFVRRLEAEKVVSAKERHEALTCAFCFGKIVGQVAVIIAMRAVHPACAKDFDAWIESTPAENDPRWTAVTNDTLVEFDGEETRWGDLMLADRKTVEIQTDGRLVGGYPL